MSKGTIIVGAGRGLCFAQMLHGELKGLNRKVVALVDINTSLHSKIRDSLDRYGAKNTRVMTTLTEALAEFSPEEADSVLVVASNKAHAILTEEALAAGRHVMLEKPIAANWNDAVAISKAAEKTDKIVQLGFVLRYSPYFRKIQEIANSGALGKIVMSQINERLSIAHSSTYRRAWRRKQAASGGFMNEKCSHDLDVLCWIKQAQAKPLEVISVGGKELFPDKPNSPEKCVNCPDQTCPFRQDLDQLKNLEFDLGIDLDLQAKCTFKTDADVLNHQSVIIKFDDGSQSIFTITAYSGDPDRDIIIHGTEGFLSGKLNGGTFYWDNYRTGKRETYDSGVTNNQHGGGDAHLLTEFFECIDNDTKPAASLEDGLLSSQLAFCADLSVHKDRKVNLSELN